MIARSLIVDARRCSTRSCPQWEPARPLAGAHRPIVLAALAVVIPLGLGGAVSPVMLSEQTVLLAGPDGGRAGIRYAAGVVLTAFVLVVAIVLFGRAISLPTEPNLDASLDLVVGLVLVSMAVLVLVLGRRGGESPSRKGGDDPACEWFAPGSGGVSVRRVLDGDERHDAGFDRGCRQRDLQG